MTDAGWFTLAALLMIVAGFLAHRRWRRAEVGGGFARLVLIVVTVGAILGAPMWWLGLPSAFPWILPPLAGRLLAAASIAFAVLGIAVLERPSPARVGLHALAVEVYLAPLVVVIVLRHLDRFDWARPVTWAFFAIAGFLVIGAAPLVGRLGVARTAPDRPEMILLAASGAVLAVFATALFVVPAAPWPSLFAWAGDPLSSRLLAVMPATLAATFLAAARDRRLVGDAGLLALVYGLGVAAAVAVNAFAGKPVPLAYVGLFALAALVGGLAWLRSPRRVSAR